MLSRQESRSGFLVDLGKTKILVVEDEEATRRTIQLILKNIGVGHIVAAANGEKAVQQIYSLDGRIDMCLLDFQMPASNGLELLREIRVGGTLAPSSLPCAMLTSFSDAKLIGLAMALDVHAFLAKPPRADYIKKHVLRVLNDPAPTQATEIYEKIKISRSDPVVNAKTRLNAQAETAPEPPALDGPTIMIDLAEDKVPVGAVLAKDIRSRGQMILAAGTVLSPRSVTLLANLVELHPDVREIVVNA